MTDDERNRVQALSNQVETLSTELAAFKTRIEESNAQSESLVRDKASLEKSLFEAREAHEKERIANKELENRIASLEQELLSRGQTIATLAQEKSVKERELLDARSTIRALADTTFDSEEKTTAAPETV